CVQRVIAVGVRRGYARGKRSRVLMDEIDGTEGSRRKRGGDDCVGAVRKDSGVPQGDSGLLTELRSESDRMEYRPGEDFVEEVRLVENIIAVGRVVVCGPVKRSRGGIDCVRQRTIARINVLIKLQVLREHPRVSPGQSVSESVVDKRHGLLHGRFRTVQIGAAEKRREIPAGGEWSCRIE